MELIKNTRNIQFRKLVVVVIILLTFVQMIVYLTRTESSVIKNGIDARKFVLNTSRPINECSEWRTKDECSEWRTKEIQRLGDLVQRRLYYLQNPNDCKNAKKILCNFAIGAGFGSQLNDWTFCLIVAYANQRTLIVNSTGWQYAKQGLETMFLPLSTNCTLSESENVYTISRDIRKMPKDIKVVKLPRNFHVVKNRPFYLPLSIPDDIADEISRVHKNPSVWWVGQFLVYLMRQNQELKRFMERNMLRKDLRHPIVGMHVRRTDKKIESKYFDLGKYMYHVDHWFDSYERKHGAVQRRVYLASDEPTVILNAKKRYPNYTFLNNMKSAIIARKYSTRYSESSLRGIVLDIEMLSMCDFVVCTMSSNVGRLVYELMHVRHWDAPDRLKSLDIEFAFQFFRSTNKAFRVPNTRFRVVKDNSKLDKLTITADNRNISVRMPTYPEVPRYV